MKKILIFSIFILNFLSCSVASELSFQKIKDDLSKQANSSFSKNVAETVLDGSEKESLFQQVLKDYQKYNEINTQIQVDMANRAWEWIEKRGNRKKVKQTEAVVNVVNNTEKKNHTSQKSSYYKRPKNFQINFTPDIMKEF